MRALAVSLIVLAAASAAHGQAPSAEELRFRDIYRELIEIDTTDSAGDTTRAAEAMATRLRAAGVPAADVQVLAPHPRKGNLVARLRGSGARRPLLLLAHLDVVEARREDWSFDPFKLLEKDGYFHGRGTIDDKAMAAIFVDTLIRFKESGFVPDRDLVLALTADEDLGASSRYNGVRWLLANHRPLIDAEFALNEGGGGELRDGRHVLNRVQTSEKVPLNVRLEVTNKGGHSSRPERDNAILRTTCVTTRLEGGHANNALPQLFVDATDNRTHGRDERIGVRDLVAGREFLSRLVRALSTGSSR